MTRLGEKIPSLHGTGMWKPRTVLNNAEEVGGSVDDTNFNSQGLAGESLNTDLLQTLDLDFINEQWFNTLGDGDLLDDSMYGLFTS